VFQTQLDAAGVQTPHIIAADEDLRAIAMTAVEGRPLEDLIWHAVRREDTAECCKQLRQAAAALAEVHRLDIPADVAMPTPCSNREYARRLKALQPGEFVKRCLRTSVGETERLLDSLDADFWNTHEKRVLHGDCQPKNFLIDQSGGLTLIDLSYECGHPLHDVANFLVQLERLFRKFPTPRAARLIATFKSVFLEEYAARGLQYLMPELPFFRLWTMTFSLMQDERHPSIAKLYLRLIHRKRSLYSD
jgi:aminoglycoside phosphotransferase (APT) family kinase protein